MWSHVPRHASLCCTRASRGTAAVARSGRSAEEIGPRKGRAEDAAPSLLPQLAARNHTAARTAHGTRHTPPLVGSTPQNFSNFRGRQRRWGWGWLCCICSVQPGCSLGQTGSKGGNVCLKRATSNQRGAPLHQLSHCAILRGPSSVFDDLRGQDSVFVRLRRLRSVLRLQIPPPPPGPQPKFPRRG
jgi:hypothetical protein